MRIIAIVAMLFAAGPEEQTTRPHTHWLISNEILRLGGETEGPSKLVRVVFRGPAFENAHFEMLSHLHQLREFHCSDVKASSSAMKYLEMLPLLERIDIDGGGDLVNGFRFLKTHASLKEIRLQNTAIAEESLNAIVEIPNLRFLQLDHVTIQQSAVDVLSKIATKVEVWCVALQGISEADETRLENALFNAENLRKAVLESNSK